MVSINYGSRIRRLVGLIPISFLQSPVTLVEPQVELGVIRGGEDVEMAIAVDIANRQAMALGIAQALPGVAEACLPVIPPDSSFRFPAHQGIGIAIGVQIGEEDSHDGTAAEALPGIGEDAGLPALRAVLVGPDGCPCCFAYQSIQVAIAVQIVQGDGAAAGCAG